MLICVEPAKGTAGGQGRTRSQRTSLVSNMAGAAKLQLQQSENHSVVEKLNSSQDNPPSGQGPVCTLFSLDRF